MNSEQNVQSRKGNNTSTNLSSQQPTDSSSIFSSQQDISKYEPTNDIQDFTMSSVFGNKTNKRVYNPSPLPTGQTTQPMYLSQLYLPEKFTWETDNTDNASNNDNSTASKKTLKYHPKNTGMLLVISICWNIFVLYMTFFTISITYPEQFKSVQDILIIFTFLFILFAVGIGTAYVSIMGLISTTWIDIDKDSLTIERGIKRKGKVKVFPRNEQTSVRVYTFSKNTYGAKYTIQLTHDKQSAIIARHVLYEQSTSIELLLTRILTYDFEDL